jgi:glucosamine kinase
MELFLGIDGGGTRTRAIVVDAAGQVLGRGESRVGNIHHATLEMVGTHLAEAMDGALRPSRQPRSAIRSVFMGMAGTTGEETREVYRGLARTIGLSGAIVEVDHDIRIALAGGLAGRPGIALIVGPGRLVTAGPATVGRGRPGAGGRWWLMKAAATIWVDAPS